MAKINADPIEELRGRCMALEALVYSILYAALKAGPEGHMLKRLIIDQETALVATAKQASTDEDRKITGIAVNMYRNMITQLAGALSAKETKN